MSAVRSRRTIGEDASNKHHICWFCQRQFQKKEHLLRHERVHSGERPFACKCCGKTYARRDTLQRHERLHQEGDGTVDGDGGDDESVISSQPTPVTHPSSHGTLPTPPTDPVLSSSQQQQHQQQQHQQQQHQQQQHPLPPALFPPPVPDVSHTSNYGCAVDSMASNPLFPNWFNSTDFQIPQDFILDPFNLNFDPILPTWSMPDDQTATTYPSQPASISTESAPGPDMTQWFSYMESPLRPNMPTSVRNHSAARNGHDVDENYRIVVQTQLNSMPPPDAMPSTAFLNRCLRLYIEKFSRLMPVVHLPTFRPTERNAWLVVSMCTTGSQLVGTSEAIALGQRMFESVQRTVLASWQSLLTGTFDSLSVLQAVVIGQAYAMLSSNPSHLLTAQAFHGTLVFCYRKVVLTLKQWVEAAMQGNHPMPDQQQMKNVDMIREIVVRVGCVLRIVDVELAMLCHQIPIMVPPDGDYAPDYSDQEFSVQAQETKTQSTPWPQHANGMPHTGVPRATTLVAPSLWDYSQLADALSEAVERRQRSASKSPLDLGGVGDNLTIWYQKASERVQLTGGFHLDCLWHSGWLAILCDVDQLEIALGREGPISAEQVQDDVRKWAASEAARHALLHAYLIQKALAAVTVSEWPAIHVPRCAYQAGVIFCGIAKFSPLGQSLGNSRECLERLGDVRMLIGVGSLGAYDWWTLDHEYDVPSKMLEHAHSMGSLLRRIGPWGLSLNLARTLDVILGERY